MPDISTQYPDEAYPKVTVIIPTYNSALLLPLTLESLLSQDYPELEIVVVDASSEDRTIEAVKSYGSEKIRVYSVSQFQPFEMLNRGISLATGEYINFLNPGDLYLFKGTLKFMMGLALSNGNPDVLCAASLVRVRGLEVSLWSAPLNLENLSYGEEPTFLKSCFFEKSLFQQIGKFDPSYRLRGDFDLFCRFCLKGDLKSVSTSRVVVDTDEKGLQRKEIWENFKETWKILYRNFGLKRALRWLMVQEDLQEFINLSLRDVKRAFIGAR
jgi:Glycosyltransferases involved in cell wall biogenesis